MEEMKNQESCNYVLLRRALLEAMYKSGVLNEKTYKAVLKKENMK